MLPAINAHLLAQEPAPPPFRHVRSLSSDARELLAMGGARSVLIRSLLDRLEASDLVVYVDVRWFSDTRMGQLAFVASAPGVRYVAIHIACGRTALDQLAALAHELRHAVEVADAAAVVDLRSFGDLYAHIGIDVGSDRTKRQFETDAAVDAGRYAKGELAVNGRSRGER
jgi:hypothetical protein